MDSRPALLLKNFRKDLVEAFPDIRDSIEEPVELSCDPRVAAARHAYSALVKKWIPTQPDDAKALSDRAIAGFIACNNKCAGWVPTRHPLYSRVLEAVRTRCYDQFDERGFCWSEIFLRSRVGPGASVASRGRNSQLEKLFLNRMSTTNEALYKEYRRSLRPYPLLFAAECLRLKRFKTGAVRLVEGSTLSCVRKNFETDRTVCTEASLDMYAQLGLGESINDLLKLHYGYDPVIQQVRNRELARRGSVSRNICTIDSTSCSDLIALQLTDWCLHPVLSAAIGDCRATSTKINGKYVKLHMVSSMGNGFTFPLMTYLFCVIIESLCEILEVPFRKFDVPGSPFGVFGDDICVPTHLYEPLVGTLEALGFIPNLAKSFSRGEFRESCGGDYLNGDNIRGVYITKLNDRADSFSAINRLNLWSARHNIPLRRTIRALLPKGWNQSFVPCDESDTAGIKCNWYGNMPSYTCLVPKVPNEEIYWELTRKMRLLCFKKPRSRTVVIMRGLRGRFDNPIGVMFATISGSLVNGLITRRQRVVDYEVVVKFTPSVWACDNDFTHDVALRDWEIQTAENLGLLG